MKSLVKKWVRVVYCKAFAVGVCILVAGFTTAAQAQNNDEIAVRQLLQKQVNAWNKGSIEEFMTGYLQSDSLVFIGKNGPKYGYQTTLENYRKNYPDTALWGN